MLGSKLVTLALDRHCKYGNGLADAKKFQPVVHTCRERVKADWARGGSANE